MAKRYGSIILNILLFQQFKLTEYKLLRFNGFLTQFYNFKTLFIIHVINYSPADMKCLSIFTLKIHHNLEFSHALEPMPLFVTEVVFNIFYFRQLLNMALTIMHYYNKSNCDKSQHTDNTLDSKFSIFFS
jgi:hypothetical protein